MHTSAFRTIIGQPSANTTFTDSVRFLYGHWSLRAKIPIGPRGRS